MLKHNVTGGSGELPPERLEAGPELIFVDGGEAANQGAWCRAASQARRQRRLRRATRARGRDRGGWTLALW